MKLIRQRCFLLLLVAIIGFLPLMAYANSMEPPSLVIIIPGHYEGLSVELVYEDGTAFASTKTWPTETQHWFYANFNEDQNKETKLHVEWQQGNYTLQLPKDREAYHMTYTLDMEKGLLVEGKTLFRSILLVGARVILTLVIEGAIFWLMGFRTKKSLMIFLSVNFITQTALNIFINSFNVASSYPIIGLVFGEFWVFIVEIIVLTVLLQEHTKVRRAGYAFFANAASLVLGGYLLTWLPL